MRKANSLCAADVGTCVQLETVSGVVIRDEITSISMSAPVGRDLTPLEVVDGITPTILVQFRNVAPPRPTYNDAMYHTYFQVAPDADVTLGGESNG